ncbi:acyloxyacyl hydrolase [Aureispira anguillae]|uniref:Acyloxyacyl hydrolase n=1 Tax=Aureispira anguillae TaxID=2864201 RepID=A0A915YIZ3_9BACT|nr:acyloxyacyl hydrolase [Aureispira anguillae]BDS13831.1 acyloxyacyl hydrolase [Aureispira anguillae]
MKRLIFVLQLLVGTVAFGQQHGVEVNYQLGTNIPIHPRYPAIKELVQTTEIAWLQRTQGKKIWSILYKQPTVAYLLAYQTLGNKDVLGEAFYLVPCLDFKLFKAKRFDWLLRVGWGAGLITKTFNSFTNKKNIVIGAPINACATVRTLFRYQIADPLHLYIGAGITHYSNGGFTNPNLGINIPFAQIGIQYSFNAPKIPDSLSQQVLAKLPALNQSFRPFINIGLGLTENGTRGPKYPIYSISLGVSRLMARISKLSLSVEYLYNTAPYVFDRHNGGLKLEHLNYARLSVLATHELLFGHWGLVTAIGVYVNKHRFQRSVIASKVGFNFYLHNYFKKFKHQLWMGCHIRAYAGEAEFVELVIGYNW